MDSSDSVSTALASALRAFMRAHIEPDPLIPPDMPEATHVKPLTDKAPAKKRSVSVAIMMGPSKLAKKGK